MKYLFFFASFMLYAFNALATLSIWDGTRTKFTQGIGIESDPYIISSASQLAYLSDGGTYDGKYFSVNVDIDLANISWIPIGAFETAKFKGFIDFNGHSVSNLNVDGDRAIGLFGYIEDSTIKNLILKDSKVSGLNLVGGVVASAVNSNLYNIENYSTIYSTGGMAYVGGVAGLMSQCNMQNVINYGFVSNNDKEETSNSTTLSCVGGVVGKAINSTVTQCANLAPVTAYSVMATAEYYTAGIVGKVETCNISYCFNTGNITCRLRNVRWHNGGTIAYVSGITNACRPSNCYNTGIISGCSYWRGKYAAIVANYDSEPSTSCFSTWDIIGCSADSYTCLSEDGNGLKVTTDELNTTAVVNSLNDGKYIFCKDLYPYVNKGLPFFYGVKKYNICTELPSEVSSTFAVLKGAVFCTGCDIIRQGFRYCRVGEDYKTVFNFGDSCSVTDLMPNQKYSYYFFAELSSGEEIRGNSIEFTTSSLLSEVYTLDADSIADDFAIIKGAIILNGDEKLIEYGVEYKTADGYFASKSFANELQGDYPYFFIELDSLNPGTVYRYRTFAKLNNGIIYGDYKDFHTTISTSVSLMSSDSDITVSRMNGGVKIFNGFGKPYVIYFIDGSIFSKGIIDNEEFYIELPAGVYIILGRKYYISF